MIFYTLQGPSHIMEIHDDKIRLIRKGWFSSLSRKPIYQDWAIQGLAHFEIAVPQYILWGKLEWHSFDGHRGSFRFSTNALMVKKIEKYLQKLIVKNHQKIIELPKKKNSEIRPQNNSIAA